MIITWVSAKIIKNANDNNNICYCCKNKIEDEKMRVVNIQYKGFGRGDDDVFHLHKNCCKPLEKEGHIDYAKRLLSL